MCLQQKFHNREKIYEILISDQESLFSDQGDKRQNEEICLFITYKAEKVDEEEDELDKICTAAHDQAVRDSR